MRLAPGPGFRCSVALLLLLALSAPAWALPTATRRGLVAAAHPEAARAGARVLAQGGNAADALVAAAFALAVVEPHSSGLGGGGFALLFEARTGALHALDFREVAPAAAGPALFIREGRYEAELSRVGGRSVGVPGAVAGYVEVARRHGSRPLPALVEPAAVLAERGFVTTTAHLRALEWGRPVLDKSPLAATAFFADGEGVPGRRLRQPALARTLRDIGRRGAVAFYRGKAAAAIERAVAADGGILTRADLAAYQPRTVAPLEGRYRGHRVVTFPPPSAGGFAVLATLGVMERFPPETGHFRPVARLHRLVEAWKRSYAARALFLGDPRAEPEVSTHVERLLAPETLDAWASAIRPDRATSADEISRTLEPTGGGEHTSHLCVVDAAGNVALMTTTVNGAFGSGVYVPELGVLLNNQMDDFSPPAGGNLYGLVGGRLNALAPGKTPLSTMAPTIVFDGDRPWLVLGAPGGSTIATTIAQVILSVVDDGMDVQTALALPRLHAQHRPDELRVEPWGLEDETARALAALGHAVTASPFRWGNATAITVDRDGLRRGAADPRGEGVAVAEDQL